VRHAADLVQRLDAVRTDLAALPDGDHAEPRWSSGSASSSRTICR
jgi:hypothetical protein